MDESIESSLADSISKQADVVRKLKESKADKTQVNNFSDIMKQILPLRRFVSPVLIKMSTRSKSIQVGYLLLLSSPQNII